MKLFQLLPKKLYDFACNLPPAEVRRIYDYLNNPVLTTLQ